MAASQHDLPEVIALCGPTGCGKTALAVKLAGLWNCEIINADSRQLYADFPIITAQPSEREQCGVAHHLYGMLATNERLDAAAWAKLATQKAIEIIARGKLPLLVGGSGFYLRALFEGLADIPPIAPQISQKIAAEMACLGVEALYARLSGADAELASKIHPHDRQRVMRGLEVLEGTGRRLSSWQKNPSQPLCRGPIFFMDADLPELTPRLRMRIDAMLENGAAAEALNAYNQCGDLTRPGWSGVGCREALGIARGEAPPAIFLTAWHKATRAYAKRQLTWFRGCRQYIRFRNPGEILAEAERGYKKAFFLPLKSAGEMPAGETGKHVL